MKKYVGSMIGIDQGDTEVFSDFADGGEMWTGTGPRERRKRVKFSQKFKKTPSVHTSLSLFDIDNRATQRAEGVAENVSEDGFDLVFRTWSDTRVARVRMAWMAIGQVVEDDDWDLG